MELTLQNFTPAEQATFRLRALYEQGGYRKYRASRFEEYALYQEYQRFLPDPQVITFTDLDGKLRAIKPDVTLSIAKTAQPAPGECKRFYYNEEVCRASRESHPFQTIHQMGLECMGEVDEAAQAEVLRLALASLAALDVPTVLEVSHMGFVTGLLDVLDVPATAHARLVELLCAKNEHELRCRPVLMKPEPMPFAVCLPCMGRSGPPLPPPRQPPSAPRRKPHWPNCWPCKTPWAKPAAACSWT